MTSNYLKNKIWRTASLGLTFASFCCGAYWYMQPDKTAIVPNTQQITNSEPTKQIVTQSLPLVETQTKNTQASKQKDATSVAKQADKATPTPALRYDKNGVLIEVNTLNGDPLAEERKALQALINNHKYSNRPAYNKQEWKRLGLPRADRPDWAFEQDFLRTMNPATGKVPADGKDKANRYTKEYWENPRPEAAIPVNWTERGPNNIAGRARAVLFDANDATNKKVYVGGSNGGLWFTNDITTVATWTKVDDLWDNLAVNAIAQDPRVGNTNNIYVGTGEAQGGDGPRGAGIWRTTNGGTSWARMAGTAPTDALGDHFRQVARLAVHPTSGNVFAANTGAFANTGGVMRFDGTNWIRVLAPRSGVGVAADAGMGTDWGCDIEIASNGDIYASIGISTQGKIYKSTNGGTTWTELPNAIAGAPNVGRIEMAVAPSNANTIYAVARDLNPGTNNADVSFFRKSTDGGTTWTACAIPMNRNQGACTLSGTDHFTRAQAFHDLAIKVHPTNANLVIVGGIDVHRTIDGGTSWANISFWTSRTPASNCNLAYVHADLMDFAFRPGNTNEVLAISDGASDYSTNAGDAAATNINFASRIQGHNITQFYSVDIASTAGSQLLIGGTQDNGSLLMNGVGIQGASSPSGGDGAYCFISKTNSDIRISSYTNCNYYRTNNGATAGFTEITSASPLKGNGSFINPTEYDSDADILYANIRGGGNNSTTDIFRISALSSATPTIAAVTITGATPGTNAVTHLKKSPHTANTIFLGLESGNLLKVTNANATPVGTAITGPAAGSVSCIEVGATENQLLVTYSNYGLASQVWESADGGATWRNKKGNLPDMPVRWCLYNPQNRNQVLLATEVGVWSADDFNNGGVGVPVWGSSSASLANTRCDMMKYRASDGLVAIGTHGRGIYTTDVFVTTPVAEFSASARASCTGNLTVNFTDGSVGANNNWAWDIDNNGSTDYTVRNPTHTYTAPGVYSVKLTINSGAATTTKVGHIVVMNATPTAHTGCTITANNNNGNNNSIGISRFALGTIDNVTPNNDGGYNDYACTQATALALNTAYTITITTGTLNAEGARVYIDYNNNGNFGDAGEDVASFAANTTGTRTANFTTPATGVTMSTGLRARVVSNFGAIPTDACDNGGAGGFGQIEDYAVFFQGATPTITLGGAALTAFTSCAGSVSAEQQYTVTGTNLTANIAITAPAGFELSLTSGGTFTNTLNLTQTGGNVATTTIFVRQTAGAANNASGNITHTSTSANNPNNTIPVSTVNPLPTITGVSAANVNTAATTFNLSYTGVTNAPNQYSITTGATAMAGFVAVTNVALTASPLAITIPASAANTYDFNLTVRNSTTGCVSAVVPFTLTVSAAATPTITLGGAALTAFTSCAGTVSAEQQYTVAGANLTANIAITAPAGFELSLTSGGTFTNTLNLTQTGGNVNTTTIFVRQTAGAANNASGNITHISTSANNPSRAIPTSTVNALPAIGTQPTASTICAGANTTFTVAATGAGLTYQWQEKVGVAAFANITNGGVYGGATTANLTLTGVTAGLNTNQYQCIVGGTCTPTVTTTPVALTVNGLPTITTQPTAQSTCVTGNATFAVVASGAGLTYQWQEKVGVAAFANITNGGVYGGATTANLTLTGVTAGLNTNQYQCIVGGTCTPSVTTTPVALTVTAGTTFNTQPTAQAGCVGGTVNFVSAASGSGIVTYQWQEKVGVAAFANITNGGIYSGATSATLTLTGITAGMNTNEYQCIATSTCGTATSTNVALTVNAATVINTQPTAQTICLGANATFTVVATGTGLTYQWQEKVGVAAFANITNGGIYGGATSANLVLTGVTAGLNTNQYQCVITSTCGNLTSSAVALTINALPAIGTQPTAQTTCAGGNATFTVAATGAGLTYQWQEKVGVAAFANITNGGVYGGATSANLVLTGVTAGMSTNQYQCIVSGTCTPTVTSAAVALTINALPTITTQPTASTICAGANTTFTVAATGTGLTYQWQEKVGVAAFANITNGGVYSNATTATLTLTGVTAGMNTNQYQCIVSGTCTPTVTSTAVALTVNALPAITTQPTAQSTCVTGNATFAVVASGAGLTYQWQEKVGVAAFANITNGGVYGGATSANLVLTGVTAGMSTNQYQCIVGGTCTPSVTTTPVALTVTAGTTFNTQPTAQAGCVGGTVNFVSAASGSGLVTYQWQEKVGVAAFTNITNGGIYSGATSATLTLTGLTAGLNTNQYQCIATSTCGVATSTAVALTINTATSITTQPTAMSVCVGSNATFTVAGAGQGVVTYQWQEKVGAGAFTNITNGGVYAGATTTTLALISVTAPMNTNQYQCIVTAGCGSVTSNAVTLGINTATSITTQPTAQTACVAGNATFSVAAAGLALTYQWQEKVGVAAFANITNGGIYGGATSANLVLTGVTAGMNTNQYQCVVTGTCPPSVTTTPVALTVTAGLVINTQPTAQTICATQNATFTVAATGAGLTYQWQEKVGVAAFANITNGGVYSGATTASLTLTGATVVMSTNQYQCVINSSCGNLTSSAVALTVNPATTITAQPTAQTICVGQNATFATTVTGAGVTYQWQEKVGAAPFANITNGGVYGGATTATLVLTNPAIGLSTNQYQCVITSTCGNLTSSAVALTINALPAITTQPTAQVICSTGNATFTVAATGAGLTYQWQEKVGVAAFANITNGGVYAGATTNSLTLTGVPIGMSTNQYQCIVSGACTPSVTSTAVALTVNAGASVTTQPAAATICAGQNTTFAVVASGAGLTYQWQEKVGVAAFANITNGGVYGGATSANLVLTGVTAGMSTNQYQCVITAGCGSLNSNAVALTVNTAPAIGTQPTAQTVCANATATFTVAATGTGLTYQWQEKVGVAAFANITNGGVYGGATSATLTLTNPVAAMSTNQYQCVVTGTCTPAATTTPVALTVTPVNATPTLNALSALTVATSAPAQTVNLAGIGMGAGDTGQTLVVTATSSNLALIPNPTVTYTSANATGTIQFTPVAAQTGTATITVTVTDNGGVACGAVNNVVRTFVVNVGVSAPPPPPAPASQTITFTQPTDVVFGSPAFTLVATASSGLPVTFVVVTGTNNVFLSGNSVTTANVGEVTIEARQAGNGTTFAAATPVSRTFKVLPAPQTITNFGVGNAFNLPDVAWNSGNFFLTASTTSGVQPTYTITEGANMASISATNPNLVILNTATPAVGRVTITATIPAGGNFQAAQTVTRSFNVLKADQTIGSINIPVGGVFNQLTTAQISSAATSGLPVTTVVAGNATLAGNTLTINGAGTITFTFSQAGNAVWNAATTVTRSFVVAKADQTLTFTQPVNTLIGRNFNLAATASSGLPVLVSVVPPSVATANVVGSVVTPTSAGELVLELTQAGNDNFNPAPVSRTRLTAIANLTITTLSASRVCAGSNLTVNYTTDGALPAGTIVAAYLSNAAGNFDNATGIGSVIATGSGSVQVTLPTDLASGTAYRVQVRNLSFNNASNSSPALSIDRLPNMPFINYTQDLKGLTVGTDVTGLTLQWVQLNANGTTTPVAGSTATTFNPTANGNYQLQVSNNGCTTLSNILTFGIPTVTGANNDPELDKATDIYPNPHEGKVMVSTTLAKAGKVSIEVTDVLGKKVYVATENVQAGKYKHQIQLETLPSGMYIITLRTEDKVVSRRTVKQ